METTIKKATATKALKICGMVLNVILEGLACLMYCLLVGVTTIIMAIPFNPIIYWIWGLVAPKSAASALYDKKDSDKITDSGTAIWRCLNEVTQKLLPWRYKKAYLEVTMLENANLSDTLRYFECCDKAKVINDKWLSEEARNHVWNYLGDSLRTLILPQMGKLSLEQFRLMVSLNEWGNVYAYANSRTLSDDMLMCLWNEAVNTENKNEKEKDKKNPALNILCSIAKIKSLSPGLIAKISASDSQNEIHLNIADALNEYSQKKAIETYLNDSGLWEKFLQDLKNKKQELVTTAQMLMSICQYEKYVSLGFKLSMPAVESFLSRDNYEMARLVIKNDVIGREISPKAEMLIKGNTQLSKILLELS